GIEQFNLEINTPHLNSGRHKPVLTGKLRTETAGGRYTLIFTGDTVYTFDGYYGKIISINDNGKELIEEPVEFNLWRAPTDNDRNVQHSWRNRGLDKAVQKHYSSEIIAQDENKISIKSKISLGAYTNAPIMYLDVIYNIYSSGDLVIETNAELSEKMGRSGELFLPRFGLLLKMPENSENVQYFGYGPMESYIDKRRAAKVGLFGGTVSGNFEPYVFPQENSSHYGARWATVASYAGHGLLFTLESEATNNTFVFNAQHYSPEMLDEVTHNHKLKPSRTTFVTIDYKQSGIGSNSCGPELFDKYRFNERKFKCAFRIKPVITSAIDAFEESRAVFQRASFI
ncbi:MAG: beta-galactosidase small subunit, partial [Oscillospiraceae bacterium]|nr:beta-galactosidase small subunit [Oscillospiraceae bacterium]